MLRKISQLFKLNHGNKPEQKYSLPNINLNLNENKKKEPEFVEKFKSFYCFE